MITRDELREAQVYAAEQLEAAGIVLSEAERAAIEVADFGSPACASSACWCWST
jgi:hypothetical protein